MSMVHEPLRYAHTEGHTDVCYTEDGKAFITVGADGDIRIWSTEDNEDPIHNCIGEWALCVRQKNNNLYVATSSNDIQILSLPSGDRDGVLDRFVAPINHMAIGKSSNVIALAGEDMEIKVIQLERPNKEVQIFNDLTGPCLSVALSPDSKLLAASSGDGKLYIWDIETKVKLKEIECFPKVNSFSNAKVLCRSDFEPISKGALAYPDKNTVVILENENWSQKGTLSSEAVTASFSIVQYSPCGKYLVAASEEGDFVVWEVSTENVVCFSKHSKSIAVCGLMWNPLGNGQIVYTDVEGQLSIISDCIKNYKADDVMECEIDDKIGENQVDFGDVQFEDDDEDNENAVSVEKLKQQYMGDVEPELTHLDSVSSRGPTPRPRTPETPLQPPFMPSSTPEHLDPRYLCWNDVGVIRCYGCNADDESASKSIEVEFHDATFHNSMMMPNYVDYTMGSVSKAALTVANSSQIKVVPLSASSKEWVLKVEEYEEIVLIATSENLVCFAMANYLVKVCTIFGIQRAVISIPGPLVAMAAFKNIVLIAYHSSGVRKGDQCINMKLVKFEGTTVESKDIGSALGPESTLLWLGFSDVGTPGMMDSLGMLSLYPQTCNVWIPYCDTSRHRSSPADGFFVTTVFESYQAVGGIKCRGGVYPGFTPRPTMCELPLEPPFAEMGTDKTQLESNLFVWSTLQVSDIDKRYKETALKTFALACKNDLDQRAMEFMEMLSNPQIITLGIKYATKLEKRRMAEKLMELASKITGGDDVDDNSARNEISTNEVRTLKPVYRKLTLSSSKLTPKNKIKSKAVSTPDVVSHATEVLTPSNVSIQDSQPIDTQESLFEEEPKNPFLKCLKGTPINAKNPLSLTDKFAGVLYEKDSKENKTTEGAEKRKHPGSETEKQKEKQRKLDRFIFSKRD